MKNKKNLNIALVGNQAGAYAHDGHHNGIHNDIIASLCVSYVVEGKLPNNYLSAIYDSCKTNLTLKGADYSLDLFDSVHGMEPPGSEDSFSDMSRRFGYRNKDLFLIVFSVAERITFYTVINWISEIRMHIPKAKFILVGAEAELRDDSKKYLSEMSHKFENNLEKKLVTYEEGVKLCIELGGWCYMECSARTRVGTQKLLEEVIRAHSSKHLTQNLSVFSMIKKYNLEYFSKFLQKDYFLFKHVPRNTNNVFNIGAKERLYL